MLFSETFHVIVFDCVCVIFFIRNHTNKNSNFQHFVSNVFLLFLFLIFILSNVILDRWWAVGYYGELCKLNDVII